MLSYHWLTNDALLPIEGERTALPRALAPGEQIDVHAHVHAPNRTGSLILAITLVQEGVAWFPNRGGVPLRIPVQLVDDQSRVSGQTLAPSTASASTSDSAEVNTPFTSFSQDIRSSTKSLDLQPGETIFLPVTIRNTSSSLWSSIGRFPVLISYKWYEQGKILPIEGERTAFPGTLKPGEWISLPVKIVAPSTGHNLVVRVTLVQEGVQWFMNAGAKPLELPVTLH
jgi:hypothetical protein